MIRLHKYLAECGVASRRACEALIEEGRVSVNGSKVTMLGSQVDPDKDRVKVDGKPVNRDRKVYIVLNKPREYICTANDPQGRQTVFDLLKDKMSKPLDARLFTVGRLDYDSEGLLILTNDGELANRLTHPRHHVAKTYRVWTRGELSTGDIRNMKDGIRDEGERLRLHSICLHKKEGGRFCYEVVLHEGRKRQIRRMFRQCGLGVTRLQRIRIGPLTLGKMKPGSWRFLDPEELKKLRGANGRSLRRGARMRKRE